MGRKSLKEISGPLKRGCRRFLRKFPSPFRVTRERVRRISAGAAIAGLVFNPIAGYAGPQGGVVVGGSASIVATGVSRTDINQQTDSAIIDWTSFSIASNEHVNFNQPSSGASTLNRVLGNDPSSLLGRLTANGTVLLVNPNGILFGAGSRIDLSGLVATTANIANADFLAGNYRFSEASPIAGASVVNQGNIRIADRGLAALVAPWVSNSGLIQARLGRIAVAGAQTFTLDLYGDQLLSFDTSALVGASGAPADGSALVNNSGTLSADGGSVLLTARAVEGVVNNVINMDGMVEARSVSVVNGEIILDGGKTGIVSVSGKLDASGRAAGETGGAVKVLGDKVGLFAGANIDASGDAGGGEVLVGGNFQGNGTERNASRTFVAGDASIAADAITAGNGGRVIVWADEITRYNGDISATGGATAGNGGFVEVSGKQKLVFNGSVDLAAANGSGGNLLLDPANITISNAADANTAGFTAGGDAAAQTEAFAEDDGLDSVFDVANSFT